MVGLKQMLKNEMDKDPTFATKVSKIAGYSKPSGFYKFLNKDESEFKDIQKLIEIVQYAFPDREFNIMDEYIRTLKPNNLLARQALEYASINKLDSLFKFLLDELESSSNAESKEWALVYKTDLEIADGDVKPLAGIEKLDTMKIKTEEVKAFSFISKFYAYYDLGLISIMSKLYPVIKELIMSLPDSYIKDSYHGRLVLVMAEIKLYNNEIEEVRELCSVDCTNMSDSIKCMLNLHIGNSYMFESYDKSLHYLTRSMDYAMKNNNENGKIQSQRSLNFLSNYWGEKAQYLNENSENVSDIHEIAFSLIKSDKTREGIDVLSKIDLEKLTDRQKGFHYFYWGLATNNKKFFRLSVKHFLAANEKFYKTPSIIELRKLGEDEEIINVYLA